VAKHVLVVISNTLVLSVREITRVVGVIFVPNAQPEPANLLHYKLPTPVKIDNFVDILSGYDPTIVNFLQSGITNGFSLKFEGELCSFESKNLLSAIENPETVDAKLKKELEAHRLAGPFS
jgi:hypothetical protein